MLGCRLCCIFSYASSQALAGYQTTYAQWRNRTGAMPAKISITLRNICVRTVRGKRVAEKQNPGSVAWC